jgi:aminopeptidase
MKKSKNGSFCNWRPHYNTDNGNKSIMHWDLIVNMENGGEIYFDGKLVQKNGIFTDERLLGLNGTSDNNYQKRLSRNK